MVKVEVGLRSIRWKIILLKLKEKFYKVAVIVVRLWPLVLGNKNVLRDWYYNEFVDAPCLIDCQLIIAVKGRYIMMFRSCLKETYASAPIWIRDNNTRKKEAKTGVGGALMLDHGLQTFMRTWYMIRVLGGIRSE